MSNSTSANAYRSTASLTAAKTSLARIASIDAFRGLTFFIMIIVNELHGISGISIWLKHMPADTDAMSFPDIVFPAFLFIVGMSIPFGLQARKQRGESHWQIIKHVLHRALALITMGFFMVNAESGFDESKMPISIASWSLLSYLAFMLIWGVYRFAVPLWNVVGRVAGIGILILLAAIYQGDQTQTGMSPQWWGILGLIGWAYLISCASYILCGPKISKLTIAIAICTLYYFIAHHSNSMSNLLQAIFSQDAHAAHTSIVLCGLICSVIFFQEQEKLTLEKRLLLGALFSIVLLLAGLGAHTQFPISKIYATPTWCFFSAAICVAVYCLLFFIVEMQGKEAWINLIEPVATNPLVCYLLPFVLDASLQLTHLKNPLHTFSGSIGILMCIVYSAVIVLAVGQLNRINFKMRF